MSRIRTAKKRILAAVLGLLLCAAAGCGPAASTPSPGPDLATLAAASAEGYSIRAAVLYGGGDGWRDTLSYLQQSTQVNLEAEGIDAGGVLRLEGYDVLYLDGSLAAIENPAELCAAVEAFTAAGGTVVLDNALWALFDPEFIGATRFVKVAGCPVDLVFPDLGADLGELQGILADFALLYPSYAEYETLSARDYGCAAVCGTAVPLAEWEGCGLYTLNRYGEGLVFFTNPLLPNAFSVGGFEMQPRDGGQTAFSGTTAGCSQLLLGAFAGYAARQHYGYSISRVFGSFGAPDMAWELHYEEITGIANNSLGLFDALCREYLQVPSFTVIRNSYWWFLRGETVTYYRNEGTDGAPAFSLDFYENAYSSGTHIAAGDEWLCLGRVEDAGSYFVDYPEYAQRAYPAPCDYDGDGAADLFCGAADGRLYYFAGRGFSDRLRVSAAQVLTDGDGTPLSLGGYSAPCLADVNGDGHSDLVSGAGDGNLYWFAGDGSLSFRPMGLLLDTDLTGQSLPAAGDLDGDGTTDLAVGSNEGILLVFYGEKREDGSLAFGHGSMAGLSKRCANAELGAWLAPEIVGADRLAVGTFDGYVALFDGPDLAFSGFVTTDELNYKGNARVKTGTNCVPRYCDIDGDGTRDLVCGSLEYGLAYPVDSPFFPYAEELQAQLDYARENEYYVGVHFYTNAWASEARESRELFAHKAALEAYGADLTAVGVNQHTWYTSGLSPAQSLRSAWRAGFLWNSGFSPAGGETRPPQVSAENAAALPFFLLDGGERTLLVQNCSVLPYADPEWTDIAGRYGAPVCVYYHCDFVYESDEEARTYLQRVSDFQWAFGYNFVREDQLMKAAAAAYNLAVTVSGGEDGLLLSPEALSSDFPLYDGDYQASCGVKITFREDVDLSALGVDADVWRLEGACLYLGLNRPVRLTASGGAGTHLERVNVAAEIEAGAEGASIRFLDGGMLQAVVSGGARTEGDGWTVTERDGKTVFTKYGGADTLLIRYDDETE